jgi:hypothetical protein
VLLDLWLDLTVLALPSASFRYKTSSLSTNHVSLQLAEEPQSQLFIAVAPGGPRSPCSSVLVRVPPLLTGVAAMVGATVGLGATVVAVGIIEATDITAGAARPLGARPVMTLAGTSNVEFSPLALLLAFILTTSLCPSRGTMLLCARLSKPTARPPTSSAINSAKGKEPVESPPTVSRKQLAAESDNDLTVTFTSSDNEEEEKKEEYSETDIFGTDYSSSDNDIPENDDDDIKSSDHDDQEEAQESSDHDDQEEAQALTAHDDLIAAGSVMNDMLDAETSQQMQQERLKADEALKNKLQGLFDFSKELFITLPEYTEGTKFQYDISPANLCDHLCNNTVSPEQVYTVLSNTHNDYLVQVQAIMKERFDRLDFEPAHELQIIAYANFINNHVQTCTGSITPWINFVPWSKHAWLWSEFIAAPPDPPDPPDIPEVSLDEVHAAFAATLPALTVSDTACAQVDAAAAAFADSVSDAINIASRAASALDATSKAQAFALNAASKAASAFDYNTTSAATEAAAGACFYSRCVVPRVAPTFSTPPP